MRMCIRPARKKADKSRRGRVQRVFKSFSGCQTEAALHISRDATSSPSSRRSEHRLTSVSLPCAHRLCRFTRCWDAAVITDDPAFLDSALSSQQSTEVLTPQGPATGKSTSQHSKGALRAAEGRRRFFKMPTHGAEGVRVAVCGAELTCMTGDDGSSERLFATLFL